MNPERDLIRQVAQAVAGSKVRIIDLAQPWKVGMPHWPTHPPFLFSLSKRHGDIVLEGGVSSAGDVFTLGGHVGTHIDALCHFSRNGRLFGGAEVEPNQTVERGLAVGGIDQVAPIVRRGVLLDATTAGAAPNKAATEGKAAAEGKGILPPAYAITAAHLEEAATRAKVAVEPGDVVLIRTGWDTLWDRPREMAGFGGAPGVDLSSARWLSGPGIFAAGADTLSFEVIPNTSWPVHQHLLVEKGIHIMEALNLEPLHSAGIHEFLFIASPLKIVGGTASPIRPFALA